MIEKLTEKAREIGLSSFDVAFISKEIFTDGEKSNVWLIDALAGSDAVKIAELEKYKESLK